MHCVGAKSPGAGQKDYRTKELLAPSREAVHWGSPREPGGKGTDEKRGGPRTGSFQKGINYRGQYQLDPEDATTPSRGGKEKGNKEPSGVVTPAQKKGGKRGEIRQGTTPRLEKEGRGRIKMSGIPNGNHRKQTLKVKCK